MMLEDELRATLAARAEAPAVRPDLLDEVRGGIRRANRRRAVLAVAAAFVAVAIGVPVAITAGRPPAPGPVPQQSAPGDPTAGWQRPRLEAPTFPLTPGWTPAGAGPPLVGRIGGGLRLAYEHGEKTYIEVTVGPEPGDWGSEGDGSDRSSTVGGRPAKVRTVPAGVYQGLEPGDEYVGVRWQLADGRWVQLLSTGRTGEADVLRFARDLRLRTLPGSPVPFTVATAPAGLTLQAMTGNYLCLAPPALLADRKAGRGICLTVLPTAEGEEPDAEDERLTIGGRAATLASNDEGPMTLSIPLAGERVLQIDVTQEDVPLTREQLIRFAEGVSVTG